MPNGPGIERGGLVIDAGGAGLVVDRGASVLAFWLSAGGGVGFLRVNLSHGLALAAGRLMVGSLGGLTTVWCKSIVLTICSDFVTTVSID